MRHSNCVDSLPICRLSWRGSLERTEDIVFYDWLLLDPKESPYAVFQFYYRPWDRLRCLGVIPPSRTENQAMFFMHGSIEHVPSLPTVNRGLGEMTFSTGYSTAGCHDDMTEREASKSSISGDQGRLPLTNPPEVLQATTGSPCLPQPSKKSRDGFLDKGPSRPLPALPSRPPRSNRVEPPSHTLKADGDHDGLGIDIDKTVCSPISRQSSPKGSPLFVRSKGYSDKGEKTKIISEQKKGRAHCLLSWPRMPVSPERVVSRHTPENQIPQSTSSSPSPSDCVKPPEETRMTPTRSYLTPRNQGPSSSKRSSPSKSGSPDKTGGVEAFTPSFGLAYQNGLPVLPRGLLGPTLTGIPLRGPTGELMKKLRSSDPFRDD